jgi:outer membrane protein TolC
MSVDDLVAEALRRHPEIRSARRAAAGAWQVPSREGALPDPMLTGAIRNFPIRNPGLSSDPMSGIEIALEQDVPFPGKLGRRSAVAGEQARVADQELAVMRARLALRVRRAYWELHFAERAAQITSENEGLLSTIAQIVTSRFTLGQTSQQDVHQAEVALSRIRAQVQERAQTITSARRAVNSAVGRPPSEELPITEAPPEPKPLDRARMLDRLAKQNPALALQRRRASVAAAMLAEARYDRWPDLQLSGGYMFRGIVPGDPMSGTDMFGLSLGVTLPVWAGSKQNARVRETSEQLAAAEATVEATALDQTTELQSTLDTIERLAREIALYRNDVLPHASRALAASTSEYQVGKTEFVALLQNWQALLDTQLDFERLLVERADRLAEVRALVGEDLP